MSSPSPDQAGSSLEAAFVELLRLAPGPVFPRARQLYFRKYALEGEEQNGRFRTHLLAEEVEEAEGLAQAGYRVRALSFAVVCRDATPDGVDPDFAGYLSERWALEAPDLTLQPEPWFRGEGRYARFSASALYRSGG